MWTSTYPTGVVPSSLVPYVYLSDAPSPLCTFGAVITVGWTTVCRVITSLLRRRFTRLSGCGTNRSVPVFLRSNDGLHTLHGFVVTQHWPNGC